MIELNDEFRSFVASNRGTAPNVLRLKYHGDKRTWIPLAINHIEGLGKCGRKFIAADGTDFTPKIIARPLSVEQATSAGIGMLHHRLAGDARRVLDMTCGLGIDSRFLAQGRDLTAIELNAELAEAARYNFAEMPDVEIVNGDSTEWLANYRGEPFDLVFIDPARRGDGNTRLYNISDCAPDILSLLPVLREKSKRVMVKLSPMLDITQTIRDLPGISELHIVDERGECRELLAMLDFTASLAEPRITVHDEDTKFSYLPSEANGIPYAECALPATGMWLCEPGPGMMKSGRFSLLAKRFGLKEIHKNTHLLLGADKPEGFPGKCRRIEAVYPLSSSSLKTVGKAIGRADIAIRNLPQFTPELLSKRLGIKPGGTRRVVGCTVADGSKALIVVRKDSV